MSVILNRNLRQLFYLSVLINSRGWLIMLSKIFEELRAKYKYIRTFKCILKTCLFTLSYQQWQNNNINIEDKQILVWFCLMFKILFVLCNENKKLSLNHLLLQYLSSPEAWNYRKWMVLMQSPPENMQENEWIEKHFPLDVHWDSEIFILLGNQKLGRIFRLTKDSPLLMKHLGKDV